MEYYLDCLKNKYAEFNGRAARPEFWFFMLFSTIAGLILGLIAQKLSYVYGLAVLVPTVAVCVRRLHDTGRPGLWALVGLIPAIGLIALAVLCALEGDSSKNEFGSKPKS